MTVAVVQGYPCLLTTRLLLRHSRVTFAPMLRDYYERNAERMTRWEVGQPFSWDIEFWEEGLRNSDKLFREGKQFSFEVFFRDDPNRIIGRVKLANVHATPWRRKAELGWQIDGSLESKGFVLEAGVAVLWYAFNCLELVRVEGFHEPENKRCERLAYGLGFVPEGIVRNNICILNKWRDHIQSAILRDDFQESYVTKYDVSTYTDET